MFDFGLFAGVLAPETERRATGLRLGSEVVSYKMPVPPETPSPARHDLVPPWPVGRILLYLSL